MAIKNIEELEYLATKFNGNETPVNKVKNDKGLIERMESTKIVLTEDNKMLLND